MKLKHVIRLVILLLACAVILIITNIVWGKIKASQVTCDKCNVVLISIDTLSALHLPCYGYERNTAPNLCSFADKNINFLNSYSQSPTTLNSHFSILTSLYPHTHNMTGIAGDSLSEDYLTLAQLYKMNGYKTFYYGPLTDMHLPLNRGIERGFDFINPVYIKNNEKSWDSVYQKLTENTKQEQPSFFFLHTYAVHDPYLTDHQTKHLFTNLPEYPNIALTQKESKTISQEFISFCAVNQNYNIEYVNNLMPEKNAIDKQNLEKLSHVKNLQEGMAIFDSLPERVKTYLFSKWYHSRINPNDDNQIKYLKALYDEQIHNMDENLGKFLDLMADPILSKNTIIIITADHGEEFMEHGSLYHGVNVYRTSTQVPLIMHIPGITPKKITELAQGIDIYPTVISLTNIVPRSPLEGINLSGLINGEKNAPTNTYTRSEWIDTVAIQNNNLRYYYNSKDNAPLGLYDLINDPMEQNDLKQLNPETINQFIKLLQ